jgi:GT2 family glycosyltransferase
VISFVIASRDEDPEVLLATVRGLRDTTPVAEREIVVVDDGSVVPVSGLGDDVVLVRHDRPAGASSSRRRGFAEAAGTVLVSLDAHMSFDPGWLDPMLAEVDSGDLLCAAFWDYARSRPCAWGADLTWSAVRDWARGVHPGLVANHRQKDPGSQPHQVPSLLGACYMMLRSTYQALGGWSPLFRVWGAEEPDLSVRARKAGFGVRCVPRARVGHLNRVTFAYPVTFDHVELNQLLMLRSVFEYRTVDALEADFAPLPPVVAGWLADAELSPWRAVVQGACRVSDEDVLRKWIPHLANRLGR